jgi:hypothetical protein
MAQQNDLTSVEAEALREVGRGGLMQRVIADHIRDRLIQLGYIEQRLGGLVATAKGKLCAATHKG